jgi:uncharacterized protein (TIGR03382 family)
MSPRTKNKNKNKNKGTGTSPLPKKITRDDIESKMRELQGEVDEGLDSAKSIAIPAAIGAGVLLVLLAFLFGRRRGRKRQLVLEIKRV